MKVLLRFIQMLMFFILIFVALPPTPSALALYTVFEIWVVFVARLIRIVCR